MSTTSQTPRRSSRIASRAGTPRAPSIADSTQTGISSNRRSGALPLVNARRSTAYGASGNTHLPYNLEVQSSGFAQVFARDRGTAVERDGHSQASDSTPRRTSEAGLDTISEEKSFQDEQDVIEVRLGDEQEDYAEGNTSLIGANVSKSFGEVHEGGMTNGNPRGPSQQPRRSDEQDEPEEQDVLDEQNVSEEQDTHEEVAVHTSITTSLRTAWRFLQRTIGPWIHSFLLTLAIITAISLGLRVFSSPGSMIGSIENVKNSVLNRIDEDMARSFLKAQSEQVVAGLDPKFSKLETQLRGLKQQHDNFRAEFRRIEEGLPETVHVKKNSQTGDFEVPDDFWLAIRDRVSAEGFGDVADEAASWDSFLHKNEAKIAGYVSNRVHKEVEKVSRQVDALVSRPEFVAMVERAISKVSADLYQQVERQVDQRYETMVRNAEHAASRVAFDQIRQLPLKQLDTIAQANLIQNSELALKSVNFFSAGLGALVDPYLTSPSQARKPASWLAKLYLSTIWIPGSKPPMAALESWEEATDCWCAAASNHGHGKAQLAVRMPYTIFPTKFTIEHVPREGTLDIRSAPRWVEVWAEIANPDQRVAAEERSVAVGCQVPVPRAGYVCLARVEYRTDAVNHVQTFDLGVDLRSMGVGVKRVVVRVTENWGREWTCLYRVRMHGELAEKVLGREGEEEE